MTGSSVHLKGRFRARPRNMSDIYALRNEISSFIVGYPIPVDRLNALQIGGRITW